MQALNTRPFFTMYNIERTPICLHKNAYKIQIKQKKTKFESPQALADSFTPTSCVWLMEPREKWNKALKICVLSWESSTSLASCWFSSAGWMPKARRKI